MMKKILLIACTFITYQTHAQMHFGTARSNYSGIEGLYINPASGADSRVKFGIDLYSFNAFGDNDQASINYKDLLKDARKKDTLRLGTYLESITDEPVDMILPFLEVRGPSFMYSINRKHTVGISSRVRLLNQFTSFEGSFFNAIAQGLANTGSSFALNDTDPYFWTSNLVTDLGLTYSTVLFDNGKNVLKGGLTARIYRGNGFLNVQGSKFNGTYNVDNDSLTVGDVDFYLTSNVDAEKANQVKDFNSPSRFFDEFFGNSSGEGFGGDVGLSYEYRDDPEKYYYAMDGETRRYNQTENKYKYKVGASVLDIGEIKYKDSQRLHVTGAGNIQAISSFEFTSYNQFKDKLTASGFTVTNEANQATIVNLPTRFQADVDVRVIDRIYVNGAYMQGFYNETKVGNNYPLMAAITPRFESRLIDAGIPISYNDLSKEMKMGLGVRLGVVTFGSDDLLGLVGNSTKGFNVYFGIKYNFYHRIKDKDGDMVSDKVDVCPTEKGTWEYKGCPIPDKDGDGILDNEDKCPTEAGTRSAMGCPDKDGDGITDASDSCPDVFGLAALQGCPDGDGDGIADKDDDCPLVKGEAKYKGCPDTDGDGLVDAQDKCPLVAGTLANEGCPDTDGDGVHDGVDRCINKPGPASNSGCPVITTEVKKRLAFAATAIQFDFGKATIKKTSNKLLDEIVAILNEYSDYMMSIDGHTDNVGNDAFNMTLSKDRAAAVRAYFIDKGITAERLVSEGYGESAPVAPNKTSAGRAKNRRVAMDLKLK